MGSYNSEFEIFSWTLYGIGIVLIACRIAARRIQLGSFKKLQWDDILMLFIVLTFTGVIAMANEVFVYGTNYVPPGVTLTPASYQSRLIGSKIVFALEECNLVTLWLLKVCILLLYSRLTHHLRRHIFVKILAWYCGIGFVVIQILVFGVWCVPFRQNFVIAPANLQCSRHTYHIILTGALNVSSDVAMILIPLPLVISCKLPLKQKMALCLVFSLGIFVILAASLSRYYTLSPGHTLIRFLNWYVGELCTAVYVANIPHCWPLIRHIFSLEEYGKYPPHHGGSLIVISPPPPDTITTQSTTLGIQKDNVETEERKFAGKKEGGRINGQFGEREPWRATFHSGRFVELQSDPWQEMLGRHDEERAIGWSPHSPALDLVDYGAPRKVDMKRINTDEIIMTVRLSQYSSVD